MSVRSRPPARLRSERPGGLLRFALVAASLQLAGCMVGPDYKRPPVVQPEGFKSETVSQPAPPIATDWWRLYADPNLDQLIATATASNQSLKLAVARVDEARALARIAASYLAPTISVDPSFSRVRYSGSRDSTTTGQPVQSSATVNDWLVPFDLTYEVDVWGRVRRGLQAARAQAVASADDEAAVRLTVQTDVAQYYYTLRLLDAQVEILTQTVAAYQEQVRVLSVQLRTGLAARSSCIRPRPSSRPRRPSCGICSAPAPIRSTRWRFSAANLRRRSPWPSARCARCRRPRSRPACRPRC